MYIQEWCGHRLDITNPDEHTSIADLAQFVTFDPKDGEYEHGAAYHALVEEYGNREATAHELDYYDGWYLSFADGSSIRYHHN